MKCETTKPTRAEKARIASRKYYRANKAKVGEYQRDYAAKNAEKLRAYQRAWRAERHGILRAAMLAAYGGKCACCGETEPKFLELDHIFNDGAEHRRRYGHADAEWIALHRAGWPKDRHQLLCSNCNRGKLRNNGVCPHAARSEPNAEAVDTHASKPAPTRELRTRLRAHRKVPPCSRCGAIQGTRTRGPFAGLCIKCQDAGRRESAELIKAWCRGNPLGGETSQAAGGQP